MSLVVCVTALHLGCNRGTPLAKDASGTQAQADTNAGTASSKIAVTVDGRGYTPSEVTAKAGQPLTMVFTRTVDVSCGAEVVFPDQKIRKPLPVGEPVEITFTPSAAGTIAFVCGMDMMKGTVVVQ